MALIDQLRAESADLKPKTLIQAEQQFNALLACGTLEPPPVEEEPLPDPALTLPLQVRSEDLYVESTKTAPAMSTPSLDTATLRGELFDIDFEYIDMFENDFSVVFVVPKSFQSNIRPTKPMNFELECAKTSKRVLYVGEPKLLPRLGLRLFLLVIADESLHS